MLFPLYNPNIKPCLVFFLFFFFPPLLGGYGATRFYLHVVTMRNECITDTDTFDEFEFQCIRSCMQHVMIVAHNPCLPTANQYLRDRRLHGEEPVKKPCHRSFCSNQEQRLVV